VPEGVEKRLKDDVMMYWILPILDTADTAE
jgi:hypothetical protein